MYPPSYIGGYALPESLLLPLPILCLGLPPNSIPLVQGCEPRQGKAAIAAPRALRPAPGGRPSGGFYHSYLLLCSYNSPLQFGMGTRLTVTGMGSHSSLGRGVPVFDHNDQSLGGEAGVRTGSEPPFCPGAREPSPPARSLLLAPPCLRAISAWAPR